MPLIGSLGPSELLIVLVIVLIIFGARRLPELGAGLGKGIRNFQDSLKAARTEETPQVEAPKEEETREES